MIENKVYCKDCIYYRTIGFVLKDCEVDGEHYSQSKKNTNFNCKYYKRKLWKFWVKI